MGEAGPDSKNERRVTTYRNEIEDFKYGYYLLTLFWSKKTSQALTDEGDVAKIRWVIFLSGDLLGPLLYNLSDGKTRMRTFPHG